MPPDLPKEAPLPHPIGSVEPTGPRSIGARLLDILISALLASMVVMTSGAFYYNSMVIRQQLRQIESATVEVDYQIQELKTASRAIEHCRAELASLDRRIQAGRARKHPKKLPVHPAR